MTGGKSILELAPGSPPIRDVEDGAPKTREFNTSRYTSPQILEREKDLIFRKTWIAIARESDVTRPGDCLPIDELDESLVVVHGEDNVVRTFRNSCRHRGTRIFSGPCHLRRIECPYHSWTYHLDGRLIGVPKREGFANLDKQTHGLLSVRTECWGGFVWITFNPDAPPVREYLGALAPQLEPYRLTDMRPLYRRTHVLPCNWKAVLDQATESYHIEAVHSHSIGRVIDTVATFYGLDPHHLQTIPIADYRWRAWLDRLTVPADLHFEPDQVRLFHKYVIFPNTLINVMPYHLTVFRVFPITPDTCRFHYEFHIRQKANLVDRLRGWLTLMASLYILREDFGVLLPFQAGAKAAGNHRIPFHSEEQPLAYFHGVVDRYLEAGTNPN
ncbi:MAG: aromatic ring-hydroxylating dioxygenase subunit alpha [Deltaproteobacteria bacterium]|nr:aromatic ring-hydroxylating dioxygenase subunit alpha [Deltaproteobacteria bacterium]